MRNTRLIPTLSGIATLTLVGGIATAQTAQPAMNDADLLERVHAVVQNEIQMGNLAKTKAVNPRTKRMAEAMVTDMANIDARVMTLAKQMGLTLTATFDARSPEERRDLREDYREKLSLRNLSGVEFDRQFIQERAEAHGEILRLIRAEKTRKHDTRVLGLINSTATTFHKYRNMALELSSRLPKAAS